MIQNAHHFVPIKTNQQTRMKKTMPTIHRILLLFVLLLWPALARAQTNAFTYQGRLTDLGSAATGTYDLTFALFNVDQPGGTQFGSTLTKTAVPVNSGLFTVTLDFGANFPGADRWLEITGRTNGGTFATLTPRQQITSTPYAITAGNLTGPVAASQLTGTIDNARLNAAVSLLGLAIDSAEITDGTISNVDISSTAAIAYSKLANATAGQVLLANGSGVMTATAISGDATVSPLGALTLGASSVNSSKIADNTITTLDILDNTIADADISSSAAITHSKLANATPGTVLLANPSGVITALVIGGDATMSSAGALTLGAGSVNSSKIADNTITSADILDNTITSLDIADGTISNIDISATAAIADTKLGTIQTANKVADTALSANVALRAGGNAFTGDQTVTSGDVGIGATPLARLHVNGDGVNASLRVQVNASTKLIVNPNGGTALGALLTPPTDGLYVAGNVGVGTTAPEGPLHVLKGSAGTVTANGNSVAVLENSNDAYLSLLSPAAFATGILLGIPTDSADGGILYNASGLRGLQFRTGGNNTRMTILAAGNVGLGTGSPDAKLQVVGDVKLGSAGQLFAPGGEENLRVIRGNIIAATGAISKGSGFASTNLTTGRYRISFDTAFADTPSAVVTVFDTAAPQIATISSISTTLLEVKIWNVSSAAINSDFEFIAIGPR
jgi:hypothetical protein